VRLGGIAVELASLLAIVSAVLRSLAEVTLFANRRRVANLAYWVTGTEGSNPSLSATQLGGFTYNSEKAPNRRVDEPIRSIRGTGESAQSSE
jgi:hypothetical protein